MAKYSQLSIKIFGKNLYVQDLTKSELKLFDEALVALVRASQMAERLIERNNSQLSIPRA